MRSLILYFISVMLAISICINFSPSFAQSENKVKMWELESPLLATNTTNNVLNIELKSSPSHDITNFPIEIAFLNGSLPKHTAESIAPMESNKSGDIPSYWGLSVPSVLERIVPIKNFDVIIYDSEGKELWKKTNQSATDGRGFFDVNFNNYKGNLTILVDNIVPINNTIIDGIAPVKFTSSLVEK